MPDFKTFDQLASGHGVGIAALVLVCFFLGATVIALWRQNLALYARLEALLTARITALEKLIEEAQRYDANRLPRR